MRIAILSGRYLVFVQLRHWIFLVFFIFFSGCNVQCIEGGVGSSGRGSNIDVHARMPNSAEANPASFWKDSGQSVTASETIKMFVDGAVSMCPGEDYATKDVLVPAVFCQNGSVPKFTPYGSIDPAVVCNGDTSYSKDGFYVDTNMLVSAGDHIKFSLIPSNAKIDSSCALPRDAKIDELYGTASASSSDKGWKDVCQTPGQYKIYMFDDAKLSDHTLQVNIAGKEVSPVVTNDPTPYGNKVMHYFHGEKLWLPGVSFDFRLIKPTINPGSVNLPRGACDKVNYTQNIYKALQEDPVLGIGTNPGFFSKGAPQKDEPFDADHPLVKVLDAYKLNCWCGRICGVADNLLPGGCYGTLTYKPSASSSGKCETLFDPDISAAVANPSSIKSVNNLELDPDTKAPIPYLPMLSAKIGTSDNAYNATAEQCMPAQPAGTSCLDYGAATGMASFDVRTMPLEKYIDVNAGVSTNSHLMLGIMDLPGNYYDNIGGYNVRVTKTCSYGGGKKLYMYIGNSPPTVLPGEAGTIPVWGQNSSGSAGFEINKDNPPAAGKIYFAVDTRGYTTDHFLGATVPYDAQNNNKYRVHIFRTVWNPNFSKLFTSIRNVLLQVFYGHKGGGTDAFDSIVKGTGDLFGMSSSQNQTPGTVATNSSDDVLSSYNEGGVVRKLYMNYVTGGRMGLAVRTLIILYVMYTALGYVLGIVKMSLPDLVIRLTKVAVVITAFSPASWNIFGSILFGVFVDSATRLIADFCGFLNADDSFAFLDNTVGVLLASETWLRFSSLILSGPLGWLVFLMIVWSCYIFFTAIFKAMLGYLMLIIGMAFLMVLAPLFISFIMFQRTKQLFDGWIRMLLNFMLQPIIVFAVLAFLNQIILTSLYQMTSFSVCPTCGAKIEIHLGDEDGVYCLFHHLSPVGYTNDTSVDETTRIAEGQGKGQQVSFLGLPVGVVYMLLFYIVACAMNQFVNVAEQLANSLSSVFGPVSVAAYGASQALLSVVGLDKETKQAIKSAKRQGVTDPTKIDLKGKSADSGESKRGIEGNKESRKEGESGKESDKQGGGSRAGIKDEKPSDKDVSSSRESVASGSGSNDIKEIVSSGSQQDVAQQGGNDSIYSVLKGKDPQDGGAGSSQPESRGMPSRDSSPEARRGGAESFGYGDSISSGSSDSSIQDVVGSGRGGGGNNLDSLTSDTTGGGDSGGFRNITDADSGGARGGGSSMGEISDRVSSGSGGGGSSMDEVSDRVSSGSDSGGRSRSTSESVGGDTGSSGGKSDEGSNPPKTGGTKSTRGRGGSDS